jgi:hypothetical protein
MSGLATKYEVRVLQEQIKQVHKQLREVVELSRNAISDVDAMRKRVVEQSMQIYRLEHPKSPSWVEEKERSEKNAFSIINDDIRTLKEKVDLLMAAPYKLSSPEKRMRDEETAVPPPVVKDKEKRPVQSPIRSVFPAQAAAHAIMRTCTRYSCVCDKGPEKCEIYKSYEDDPSRSPMRIHIPSVKRVKGDPSIAKPTNWKCRACLKPLGADHRVCVMEHYKSDVAKWESEWVIEEAKAPNYEYFWKCGFCKKPINATDQMEEEHAMCLLEHYCGDGNQWEKEWIQM